MTNDFSSDIAIVGMAGRFPSARNVGELWRLLRDGAEAIRDLTMEELEASGVPPGDFESPAYVRVGSLLEGIDLFDAGFFGMSPRDAELTDPQHRVFLEIAWEALESAGCNLEAYQGSIGVFAGASASTYLLFHLRPERNVYGAAGYFPLMIGNDKDYLATRVSYRLNLRGPSVTVQTACSTSLVAVHMACQSLLAGECDMALAGGVTIGVPQGVGYWFEEGAYFSPDGRCRTFDASARGTIFGNGAGVVTLKRLRDAVADGDGIEAVIKGSAINNDGGAKVGFTAPSARGQAEVIAQALAVSGVAAETIGYVEAHGTGTALGDPIEVAALRTVFEAQTAKRQYCALGSVKTNLGHLDSAAGIAGLIKAVLCLRHRQLVPTLHYRQPNPAIAFESSPFYVNTILRDWPVPDGGVRRAGVSSFGIGGTNAHVVLEEAPTAQPEPEEPGTKEWLLPLSARSVAALTAMRSQWDAFLAETHEPAVAIGYTAAVRRNHHRHRAAVVGGGPAAWRAALDRTLGRAADGPPRLCWIFSGQGPSSDRMGCELWREEAVFRQAAAAAADALAGAGWTRPALFVAPLSADEQEDSAIIQPAVFGLQWGLAALWRNWGIEPEAVIGHSLGEVAAACVAGALTLADGARVVVERSRLLAGRRGQGAMVAVELGPEAVRERLARWSPRLELAGWNSPASCVVSGDRAAVEAWLPAMEQDGIRCHRLRTSGVAGHSAYVAGLDVELAGRLADLQPRRGTIRFLSSVARRDVDGEALDAQYWGRNLREPVRFAPAVETALAIGMTGFVELSAHPVLTLAVSECAGERRVVGVGSLTRDASERRSLLESAGRLWEAGAPLDWTALYVTRRRTVSLPGYPWQRQRFWVDPPATPQTRALRRLSCSIDPEVDFFETEVSLAARPTLAGHRIDGVCVIPASLYLALAIESAGEILGPGDLMLNEIVFRAAAFFGDTERRTLQLFISRRAGAARIELRSRTTDATTPWTLHCTLSAAVAMRGAPAPWSPREPEGPIGLAADLYQRLERSGVELAGSFRLLDGVEYRRGAALGRIVENAPPASSVESLDLLNQTLAGALLADGSSRPGDPAVPVSIEALWCSAAAAAGSPEIAIATASSPTVGNVTLYSGDGAALVHATGVRARSLTAHRTYHRIAWSPEAAPQQDPDRDTTWIVLGGTDPIASEVVHALRNRACRTVIVSSDTDGLRAMCEEVARCATAIGIVSCLALEPADAAAQCMDIARAVRALAAIPQVRSRLWIVTRGARAVRAGAVTSAGAAQASLNGLVKVVAVEHPELRPVQIDLDPAADSQAVHVIAELAARGADDTVAVRSGQRLVARLERFMPQTTRSFEIDPERAILITGGFGGLGLAVASWLSKRGCRHLVLLGRSPVTAAHRATCEALQREGTSVHVYEADVSRRAELQPILQGAGREWPALQGVFHLAGHLEDRTLQRIGRTDFERVWSPKADGGWLLHELTRDCGLEYFVLFSSAGAMVGSAGQASHAAANAALDALAHYRRSLGLPALSIGWGPWDRVGKAFEQGRVRQLEAVGIEALEPAEALESMAQLLAADEAQAGVFRLDLDRVAHVYPESVRSPFLERLRRRPISPGLTPSCYVDDIVDEPERRRVLEAHIRAQAALVLRMDAESLAADAAFDSYGMDSLRALEFRNVLEDTLDTRLSAALVWKYPTIRLLAAGLSRAIKSETADNASDEAAAGVPADLAAEEVRTVPGDMEAPR